MPASHDYIRDVLNGHSAHEWRRILHELHLVTIIRTQEAEDVLASILKSEKKIVLIPGSPQPHSDSPMDMLKFQAIQTLARWGRHDLIQRFESKASSEGLANFARVHIPPTAGE